MANIAQILADESATPEQKYKALVLEGKWDPSAATSATGYTPPASPLTRKESSLEPEIPVTKAPVVPATPRAAAKGIAPVAPKESSRAAAQSIAPVTAPTAPVALEAPIVGPVEDTASRNYQAQGEAVEADYKEFANYMRDLADKGQLVGADGKPLPMYSREKIAAMTIPELRDFAAANPGYANKFFVRPDAATAAKLEGTGRTGIGTRSGMVQIPDIKAAAKAAVASTAEPGTSEAAMEKKAEKVAEAAEDPDFQKQVKSLAKDWGVSILEVLQAGMIGYVGGRTGNWQETAQQKRLAKEERSAAVEEERAARKAAAEEQDRRLMLQLERGSSEAALDREAQRIALDKQLSMQEKIVKLQAAQRAAGVPVMSAEQAAADLLGE